MPLLGQQQQQQPSDREPPSYTSAQGGAPASGGPGGPALGPGAAPGMRRASPIRPASGAGAALPMTRPKNPSTIAPGQPAPSSRQKDKFVPLPSFHTLPDGQDGEMQAAAEPRHDILASTAIFEDLPMSMPAPSPDTSRRGRVSGWGG